MDTRSLDNDSYGVHCYVERGFSYPTSPSPTKDPCEHHLTPLRSLWLTYDGMNYSLNSLKGAYIEDFIGGYYRGYEGGYQEFRLQLI